uniref:Uncharacterized protein n=1 Tax=Tanacetum cinerariifolium TaxID=118510 RepID=A0A6L2M5X5_TANCI|nr:hypothetical protein [Tanacetum cinerariifolium]
MRIENGASWVYEQVHMGRSGEWNGTVQPPPTPPPAGPSRTLGYPRASRSSQVPPPPHLPLSTNQEGQSHGSIIPSSSKTAASAEYTAWTTADTRLKPSVSSILEDLHMDNDMAPDAQPLEEDRPAAPEPAWSIPSSDLPIPKNKWASALASNYTPPPENSLLAQTDLEYLRYSSKGGRPVLSISKMKAAYYPDVGLEQMVPDQMWIEEECKYDITAMYGISHRWFQRQQFYINRHTFKGDRRAVRTHMQILSFVRIEVFSMYGYDYMKRSSFAEQILMNILLWKETSNICTQVTLKILGFNSLVHSLRALSTLRRSDLRTASAATKPYQGDSLELYLITDDNRFHSTAKFIPCSSSWHLGIVEGYGLKNSIMTKRIPYRILAVEEVFHTSFLQVLQKSQHWVDIQSLQHLPDEDLILKWLLKQSPSCHRLGLVTELVFLSSSLWP